MMLFLLREKDPCDHPAEDTAEQKQDTQSRQQLADQRFAGFLLKDRADGQLRGDIVEDKERQDKNSHRQHKRPSGKAVEFCFHG